MVSNENVLNIKRALISVYDKTGLLELATGICKARVEIVSTGSTAKFIREAGISVTSVSEVTGFPECLHGRVKTIHPHIHAGILADRQQAEHNAQLSEIGILPFEIVVCNLYPFSETVASGADFTNCIEQIDIGGPTMVRAAAKNHQNVAVITAVSQYPDFLAMFATSGITLSKRKFLAMQAFKHTAAYDMAVSQWFEKQLMEENSAQTQLLDIALSDYKHSKTIRYGENPHQSASLYVHKVKDLTATPDSDIIPGLANAKQLSGKEMSYNNYTDADAAWRAAYDQKQPCVAIIKHANPCGIAVASNILEAYHKAHACDPVSAFGGVIAINGRVEVDVAQAIMPVFTEVIVASEYSDEALTILSAKKNLRVLQCKPDDKKLVEIKTISGGLLVQERDSLEAVGDNFDNWKLVSGEAADEQVKADLIFAWRAVRAVKSNAVLLAKNQASVGVGMGQVNRVDSCRLAVERANTLGMNLQVVSDTDVDSVPGVLEQRSLGAVAASDAFFPFPDGLQVIINAGVKAVVQPGGSIRDEQVIAAAKQAGITMYFTGTRHFSH